MVHYSKYQKSKVTESKVNLIEIKTFYFSIMILRFKKYLYMLTVETNNVNKRINTLYIYIRLHQHSFCVTLLYVLKYRS